MDLGQGFIAGSSALACDLKSLEISSLCHTFQIFTGEKTRVDTANTIREKPSLVTEIGNGKNVITCWRSI